MLLRLPHQKTLNFRMSSQSTCELPAKKAWVSATAVHHLKQVLQLHARVLPLLLGPCQERADASLLLLQTSVATYHDRLAARHAS